MHLIGKIDRRRHGSGHKTHLAEKRKLRETVLRDQNLFRLQPMRVETLVQKGKQTQDHALQMQQQTAKTRRWDLTSGSTQKTCDRGPKKS